MRLYKAILIPISVLITLNSCQNAVNGRASSENNSVIDEVSNENSTLEERPFKFLSGIKEMEFPVSVTFEAIEHGIPLEQLAFSGKIVEALNNISSERAPYVDLPDFQECNNSIAAKVKYKENYLVLVKTDSCNLGAKSVFGLLMNNQKEIMDALVLAAFNMGSGVSQEVSAEILGRDLKQTIINKSWDAMSDFTTSDTTTISLIMDVISEQNDYGFINMGEK